MGVLSNKIDRGKLKPGDHIYSWRKGYIYAHHGIYMGDGNVIHFTRGGEEIGTGTLFDHSLASSVPSKSDTPCERCGDQSTLHGVLSSCIDCFLRGGDLYRFLYSVSPVFFIAKVRGGTCTLAPADPAADVLHRAAQYLLQNGFGTYNIFKNNCEDFAIYCKTGLLVETSYSAGRSGQVGTAVSASSAVVGSSLYFLMTRGLAVVTSSLAEQMVSLWGPTLITTSLAGITVSWGPLALVSSGVAGITYGVSRVVSDVGVRGDVIKIRVESLVARVSGSGSGSGE